MSARTLPSDRSTHSSIFSRNGSISLGRSTGCHHRPAQIPGLRIPAHRLRIRIAQRRRRMRDSRRVERFENFHDLPVRLLHRPLRASGSGVITATEPTPGGTTDSGPTRNGLVRIKGDQLSAGREPTCPSTGILACPLSALMTKFPRRHRLAPHCTSARCRPAVDGHEHGSSILSRGDQIPCNH